MPKIRLYKHLVDLIRSQNASYTTPEIKRNIDTYGVQVDSQMIHKQLEWVYPQQQISFEHWPKRQLGDTSKIRIIHEDEDCLVLFKPFGLVVEKGAGHPTDNLVQWLWDNYPEQQFQQIYGNNQANAELTNNSNSSTQWTTWTEKDNIYDEDPVFIKDTIRSKLGIKKSKIDLFPNPLTSGIVRTKIPASGLVHRLDKDTQGLILVAKNIENFEFLQNEFRARTVVKKYLAVVDGKVNQTMHITNYQSRDKSNIMRQRFFWNEIDATNFDPDYRLAKSIFEPIYYCKETNQSLIQVQIQTGRMHQIRLQCEAIGHPISGDKIYSKPVKFNPQHLLFNKDNKIIDLSVERLKNLEISADRFEDIKKQIFGEVDYCLLANHLEILLSTQKTAKFELFEVDKL